MWHRTHFKMSYIYISVALVWVFGIILSASYNMTTSTVGILMSNIYNRSFNFSISIQLH